MQTVWSIKEETKGINIKDQDLSWTKNALNLCLDYQIIYSYTRSHFRYLEAIQSFLC